MVDAGVSITTECKETYEDFKMKNKYDFVIFKLNPKMTTLSPHLHPARGESEAAWGEHKDTTTVKKENDEPVEYWNMRRVILEEKSPCFAVVMINIKSNVQPILIYWCPPDAGGRSPMVYSSTVLKFKGSLNGLKGTAQCNDMEELSFSEVHKSFN